MTDTVNVWEEEVLIPTYATGRPDRNPMFFEKRVYQGSSGVVYPYPVIEKIEDECHDVAYHAVWLENRYLKVMVLPGLGGRVQMAYDKVKHRHFIYYNHVVKPALVGLAGPWISGGIEFNWPQHHRPSTFLPVDFSIERLPDGGATVWVGERERMFHQKGMAGLTLRPGRAVLEVRGVVANPTPLPQTFLWWANPAVAVGDHYRSVFPADVHAVYDHGRRDVSRYPVATGTYYKMDYSAGVDISRYRNIPVPTSFMAAGSRYDFVGGYEEDTRAGLLHVADHHIAPGKKQWTWGCGDFGQAWDRNLTDADGPYIELMTGVYTDNQPDFAWLQPYEEKSFTQYFMPYRELGVVKNATADLLMNLEPQGGKARLKLFATSVQEGLHVRATRHGEVIADFTCNAVPEEVFEADIPAATPDGIALAIHDAKGRLVMTWAPEPDTLHPQPEPASPALPPAEVSSTEQLYLTGLHLEQYRHATYLPTDYYEEALRRDPTDARCNNAMGLWLLRKGQPAKAEPYLRRAVATLTRRNPNPYDGEPYYNLGLALRALGRCEEAYACFRKAAWNAAWQDAAYFAAAQISAAAGEWEKALDEVGRSLLRNWHNLRARHLKTTILRRLGRFDEARAWAEESLRIDAFNFGCAFELCLLSTEEDGLGQLAGRMRREAHNYEELFLDYAAAGCWDEALHVADWAIALHVADSAMLHYYKAWGLDLCGRRDEAAECVRTAETMPPGTFFPNAAGAIEALRAATGLSDHTPRALYQLGNIWYDKRQYEDAIEAWEAAAQQDAAFPTVWRNLALAYYNKRRWPERAVACMERAYALDPSDARVLMELDQLYRRTNRPAGERLALLDRHRDTAFVRDDLYLEYATLLNLAGRHREAMDLIAARRFHPWEGGEGKVPAQYQACRLAMAREALRTGQGLEEAATLVEECYTYPHNLGEGKLCVVQENDVDYHKGLLLEALGHADAARECFARAAAGPAQLSAAMYYNDQQPDKIFYQGLALRKLGREDEARGRFNRLVDYGEQHLSDKFRMDYFAVSLPDLQVWEADMDQRNRTHCLYLMGLGFWGLGHTEKAAACFKEAAAQDRYYPGLTAHLQALREETENMEMP